jgi:DNA polymerase-3 subunit gamma/tau
MSYVVLARKWRPMRFSDLVGQDHVAKTLGNAIDAGRVAHAFLFTGVRGVGKTTSARILAKALNCMREPGTLEKGAPDPGPTVTPCLKCPACLEITEGRDLDVQEIDGASYNGVDEVRKLQDSLPYRPSRDRYKVIIVDEVHMLSQAAWNAFLKTLEEPPPHVKFIFATTEVHKVPITILSRVQRFDFKMIPTRLIMDRLRYVLEQEKSSADEVALGILARQAAGSMRDAMSLLDQVIAFSGGQLTGDDVARVLGVASRGALLELGRALVEGEPEKCLKIVGSLADQGFDIPHVTRDVLALLRDLVVAKVCKNPAELLDLADEERKEVISISEKSTESDLLRLHAGFSKGYDDAVRSADPRAGLEMLLVRLSLRPPLLAIDELLHRIGNLEKRLVSAGGAAPPRPRGSGGGGGPGRMEDASHTTRPRERAPQDKASSAPAPDKSDDDVHDARHLETIGQATDFPARAAPQVAHQVPHQLAHQEPSSTKSPSPVPASGDASPERSAPAASAPAASAPAASSAAASSAAASSAAASSPASKAPATPPESSYVPTDDERSRLARMMKLTDKVREKDQQIAAYLEQAVPLSADGKVLELGLEKGHVFEKQITDQKTRDLLEQVIKSEWGGDAELLFTVGSRDATPDRTVSAERVRLRKARELAAIEEVKNHPRVREAIEIFRAHVKHVIVAEMN